MSGYILQGADELLLLRLVLFSGGLWGLGNVGNGGSLVSAAAVDLFWSHRFVFIHYDKMFCLDCISCISLSYLFDAGVEIQVMRHMDNIN